jgi:hypothetical protein
MKHRVPYAVGLIAPAIICVLMFIIIGQEEGYFVGGLTSVAFFSVAILLWTRRVKRYPDDPWKVRL